MSWIRKIADRVPEEEKTVFIKEGIKGATPEVFKKPNEQPLATVARTIKEKDLKLLLSDKTNAFVLISSDEYSNLSLQSILKVFERNKTDSKQLALMKKEAVKTCERLGLTYLGKRIKESKELTLKPFFSVKTHKQGNLFRTIVEDKGTWQRCLTGFLQACLSSLPVSDPFKVPNALKVIEYIKDSPPVNCFSIDVKDLYYNIPRKETVTAVEDAIDLFGVSKFQDLCKCSVAGFLELLDYYLH
uniref:Tick transposon n=1 Tax=Rhipicephalus appendiculatus TaxID=34631 RepID=A0A131Z4B0_RHIAP